MATVHLIPDRDLQLIYEGNDERLTYKAKLFS